MYVQVSGVLITKKLRRLIPNRSHINTAHRIMSEALTQENCSQTRNSFSYHIIYDAVSDVESNVQFASKILTPHRMRIMPETLTQENFSQTRTHSHMKGVIIFTFHLNRVLVVNICLRYLHIYLIGNI